MVSEPAAGRCWYGPVSWKHRLRVNGARGLRGLIRETRTWHTHHSMVAGLAPGPQQEKGDLGTALHGMVAQLQFYVKDRWTCLAALRLPATSCSTDTRNTPASARPLLMTLVPGVTVTEAVPTPSQVHICTSFYFFISHSNACRLWTAWAPSTAPPFPTWRRAGCLSGRAWRQSSWGRVTPTTCRWAGARDREARACAFGVPGVQCGVWVRAHLGASTAESFSFSLSCPTTLSRLVPSPRHAHKGASAGPSVPLAPGLPRALLLLAGRRGPRHDRRGAGQGQAAARGLLHVGAWRRVLGR